MNKPNRIQARVLKAVHDQAAIARLMQDRANALQDITGDPLPTSWFDDFHARGVLRQALENVAADAGIPSAWVEQCRQRGELGMRWRADLHWRDTKVVDRDQLLNKLEAHVRHAQDMAAIATVYGERGARAEVGTAQLFDRGLRLLSYRINAVAHVLGVSEREADRLWGAQSWSGAADSVRDGDIDAFVQRWRAHGRSIADEVVLQAKALDTAGVTAGPHALPNAAGMTALIRAHLSPTPTQSPSADAVPGTRISEAIDAAGLTDDTSTEFAATEDRPEPATAPTMPGIEP
ncbi:hypothetical protein [Nocardia sp. NPDC056000]|uniref:hypothetical protein n=1 Tax=Nocardia sp. NPDC056000 TaxID=3345674 RepID=UPI0035D6D214